MTVVCVKQMNEVSQISEVNFPRVHCFVGKKSVL